MTTIHCDSKSAIHLTRAQMYHKRPKHLYCKYHRDHDGHDTEDCKDLMKEIDTLALYFREARGSEGTLEEVLGGLPTRSDRRHTFE